MNPKLIRKSAALFSDEDSRKLILWTLGMILSPVILAVIVVVSLLPATTQHNNAAVDLVFYGGAFPESMDRAYVKHIEEVQGSLVRLDEEIAAMNAMAEGSLLDGAWVKSVFYSLCFDEEKTISRRKAKAFAGAFACYEERTRTVQTGTDEEGNPVYGTETYMVVIPLGREEAYENLSALGYEITDEAKENAQEIYIRTGSGNGGGYFGSILYGGTRDTSLCLSDFTDPATKNAADLAIFAEHAWASGWGYVGGTFGQVLTEDLLSQKVHQLPEMVGTHESFIRENWLGGRTADCVGLIKGYGWLDSESGMIRYGENGMADLGADTMYQEAEVKGSMKYMPDVPGIALWHSGHVGVYIGNGEVIEALGTKYGVVKTKLEERNWSAWFEVPAVRYE